MTRGNRDYLDRFGCRCPDPSRERLPQGDRTGHARRAHLRDRTDRSSEREALRQVEHEHQQAAGFARAELSATGRWHPRRRAELLTEIAGHDRAMSAACHDGAALGHQIDRLDRQVTIDTSERDAENRRRAGGAIRPDAGDRETALAAARPADSWTVPTPAVTRRSLDPARQQAEQERTREISRWAHQREHDLGRGRDDGYSIGI